MQRFLKRVEVVVLEGLEVVTDESNVAASDQII